MDPREVVASVLKEWLDPSRRYPQPLPPELDRWYGYTGDGGHSILCVLRKDYEPGRDLAGSLTPVPVRAVLRGYEVLEGFVVVDVPLDPDVGLLTRPDDDEY